MQRALMQWKRPEKRALVREALYTAHREDLIGYGKNCLLRPASGSGGQGRPQDAKGRTGGKSRSKSTPKTASGTLSPQGRQKARLGGGQAQEERQKAAIEAAV
jgi:hypothetical protein